jgi:hypothetical protein
VTPFVLLENRSGDLPAEVERGLRGRHPVVLHAVAHGQRECPVVVLGLQRGRRPADRVPQVVDDAASQRVGGQSGAAVLVGGLWVLSDAGHRRSVTNVGDREVNTRRMMLQCAGK